MAGESAIALLVPIQASHASQFALCWALRHCLSAAVAYFVMVRAEFACVLNRLALQWLAVLMTLATHGPVCFHRYCALMQQRHHSTWSPWLGLAELVTSSAIALWWLTDVYKYKKPTVHVPDERTRRSQPESTNKSTGRCLVGLKWALRVCWPPHDCLNILYCVNVHGVRSDPQILHANKMRSLWRRIPSVPD